MSLAGIHVVHTTSSIADNAAGPSCSGARLGEMQNLSGIDEKFCSVGSKHEISDVGFSKLFTTGLGPKRPAASPEIRDWLFTGPIREKLTCYKIIHH